MTLVRPDLCPEREGSAQAAPETMDLDLATCVRALGGWVEPAGLAPRQAFERLVEAGALEAWPGRPLYRTPAGRP